MKLFYLSCILLFCCNCSVTNGFEDGKTLGKKVNEVKILGGLESNLFSVGFNQSSTGLFLLPGLSVGYALGLTNKLDLGVRCNLSGNFSVNIKHQIYNDQNSRFALSSGFEIGVLGYTGFKVFNYQIPLYTSYDLNEKLTSFLSPRYITFASFRELNWVDVQQIGANFGLMYGIKTKVGFDIGIFNSFNSIEPLFKIISFNMGIKHRL